MRIISDLHLHSKYSRAVSPKMDLYEIDKWCRIKGISLAATGDWQHPVWFKHLKKELEESTNGIFKLKSSNSNNRFLLSTEISSIYKQDGKGRRVHNLVFSPSIKTCEKVIKKLLDRGANLSSDGRPIIGISSRDLLEMLLNIDERIILVPAHIWTPWYSMFGSKSGFNSIEECFGDLGKYIYAVETGLSTDPRMIWQVGDLMNRSLVSFSDAHSAQKLGREATVFEARKDYTFDDLSDCLRGKEEKMELSYTIEFFPEEGKYHNSGHRACNVIYTAQEIIDKGDVCPVCGKRLTVGVTSRILELSDPSMQITSEVMENDAGLTFEKSMGRKPFVSMLSLLEILQLALKSKAKAEREYIRLTEMKTEFEILLDMEYKELIEIMDPEVASAIQKVRKRKVKVTPGYDGIYGKVETA